MAGKLFPLQIVSEMSKRVELVSSTFPTLTPLDKQQVSNLTNFCSSHKKKHFQPEISF